jgi:hypothetical protein
MNLQTVPDLQQEGWPDWLLLYLKAGPCFIWKSWPLQYLERLTSTVPSGMASALSKTAGLHFYLSGLASIIPGRAGLHYTWKGWPPLYLEGLASIIPGRAGLHYTWKGWPPLYLEGLASIIPGGPPNSGGWGGQFWPLFLPGDQAPPPPQSLDLLQHKHR